MCEHDRSISVTPGKEQKMSVRRAHLECYSLLSMEVAYPLNKQKNNSASQ